MKAIFSSEMGHLQARQVHRRMFMGSTNAMHTASMKRQDFFYFPCQIDTFNGNSQVETKRDIVNQIFVRFVVRIVVNSAPIANILALLSARGK